MSRQVWEELASAADGVVRDPYTVSGGVVEQLADRLARFRQHRSASAAHALAVAAAAVLVWCSPWEDDVSLERLEAVLSRM